MAKDFEFRRRYWWSINKLTRIQISAVIETNVKGGELAKNNAKNLTIKVKANHM